jgi:UDP-N-acetylmuramoyl-L-alanine---L-glutamate ligase
MNALTELVKNKKVLIVGFGREGQSTYRTLRRLMPDLTIVVADRNNLSPESLHIISNDKKIKIITGEKYLTAVCDYELIFKTPGIPGTLPELVNAQKQGAIITSQVNEFLKIFRNRSIGVTGTKGKSTTTSLLFSILQAGGKDVVLAGNIGMPVFDVLAEDRPGRIYVLELSSHQLADITVSPKIAVMLNLYPEHLDYYADFMAYSRAKSRITVFQDQSDILVFNSSDTAISQIAVISKAQKITYSASDGSGAQITLKNDQIAWRQNETDVSICRIADVPLIGAHNLNNVLAAVGVGVSLNLKPEKIAAGIKSFKPLTGRLESIGLFNGIEFIDDTLATIPEAAAAALNAIGDRVGTLLVGGFDRGLDFTVIAKAILASKVKTLILFPTTGEKIRQMINSIDEKAGSRINYYDVDSMEQAVKIAYEKTTAGHICLMSPASPSFGLFKDYRDRSAQFRKWVEALGV